MTAAERTALHCVTLFKMLHARGEFFAIATPPTALALIEDTQGDWPLARMVCRVFRDLRVFGEDRETMIAGCFEALVAAQANAEDWLRVLEIHRELEAQCDELQTVSRDLSMAWIKWVFTYGGLQN